jgi:hypothetical protein
MKFKIGDKVIRIGEEVDYLQVTVGKTYTVKNIDRLGGIGIRNDQGRLAYYRPHYFERVDVKLNDKAKLRMRINQLQTVMCTMTGA